MWKRIWKHKLVSGLCFVSLALVVASVFWAYASLHKSISVILHFRYPGSINQYGSIWDLMGVGVLGIVVVFLNSWIALHLEERDWFLGKFLAVATLLFSMLLFIGFAAIIYVN